MAVNTYWDAQRVSPDAYGALPIGRIRSGRLVCLAERVDHLVLPEHRTEQLRQVTALLRAHDVPYFVIPTSPRQPSRIGIDQRFKRAACSALADYVQGRPVYRIGYGGVEFRDVISTRLCETELPADVPDVVTLVAFAQFRNTNFASRHEDGVDLEFWQNDGTALVAPRWNPYAGAVPSQLQELVDGGELVDGHQTFRVFLTPRVDTVTFPVDAVYTWVNGSDVEWQQRKADALGITDQRAFAEEAAGASRFADHDELRYSLRSIEQYAPWIRRIWIVTDRQIPDWLGDDERVRIVDHQAIAPPGAALPTFNSQAIEANLHRIEGLAEHFLYLNDDMMFGRPVRPDEFFHGNGISKFFYSRAQVDFGEPQPGEIASTIAGKNNRKVIERQFGRTMTQKFFHTPYPLKKSVIEEMENKFPEEFALTRAHQFRGLHDVTVAGSLYYNYAYGTARAVPARIRYLYVDPRDSKADRNLSHYLRNRDFDCVCVNDALVGDSTMTDEEVDAAIRAFLARFIPVPAPWEADAT
ncbi:stealth conserved region 3 domain-containing protein [Saxibacter everestensis]|uniref:Stealth conserved region 3 domain-containing protein n=1 Tax=Saxibacter everestensis TaxID=2909229 RepID=A0ABY8QU19_9MICO|nr:stealth conserved region 3 domain-containing protein [Brevibacteriaceae bacterium ZFBP1038]